MFFIIAFSPFVLKRNQAPLTTSHILDKLSNKNRWNKSPQQRRGIRMERIALLYSRKIKVLFCKHQYYLAQLPAYYALLAIRYVLLQGLLVVFAGPASPLLLELRPQNPAFRLFYVPGKEAAEYFRKFVLRLLLCSSYLRQLHLLMSKHTL
jgi:hypothetical protein